MWSSLSGYSDICGSDFSANMMKRSDLRAFKYSGDLKDVEMLYDLCM